MKISHLHDGRLGAAITVHVTPRSSRNEISEIMDDGTVKIRLVSSTEELQTNKELIHFLAEVIQVAIKNIEVVAGKKGRDKIVSIYEVDPDIIEKKIFNWVNVES